MHDNNVKSVSVNAKRCHRSFNTSYISVVVRTENIYSLIELSYCKLVVVVCDIRHKICWHTVFTNENSILFVTELCCFKPKGTVFFIGMTACFELFDNSLN